MVACDREEIVVVHLAEVGEVPEEGPVPEAVSIPGICGALEVAQESMAERVALLSAIEDLKSDGVVEERQRPVQDLEGERNVYLLTEAGRERAREIRQRVADQEVVVRHEDEQRAVPLSETDQFLDAPALVRALARVTDDGVVYVEQSVGDRFVDREEERARLEDALDGAVDEGRAALVAGEAGVGKTTLVTDALAETAQQRGLEVLVGRCQEDASRPYAPYRTALEGRIGDDPFERAGIDPEDEADYERERLAMFEAVHGAVADLAGGAPLLLVVDDLHVADEPTVALFDHLATDPPPGTFLVGTYRPEDLVADHPLSELRDEEWADRPDRLAVDLQPFGPEETRGQIQWVLGRRDVPASFVEEVYDHTGGNPLFVEESVKHLQETGAIDPAHGIYPEELDEGPVPREVEEAVDIRLSVLDEDTLAVLRTGALIGGEISPAVLAAATGLSEPQLREHVDLLVNTHVWERADESDLRFVSGLVRETVVDRIPEDRRASLHERVADAIATRTDRNPDRHAAAAYHYGAAGRNEAAFQHYVQAAERATDVYAHEVALDNYERALDIAREHLDYDRSDPEIVELLEDVGDVYYLLGEYDEADRYYRYVDERTDDPEVGRRTASIRADIYNSRGQYERALELVEAAFEEYGVEDTVETAELFARKGSQHQNVGEFEAARKALERCREIGERIGDDRAIATAHLDLGALAIRQEEVGDEVIATLRAAVDAAERAGADRVRARALSNKAMAHRHRGELEEAERACRKRLVLQERIGDKVALSRARVYLAWVLQTKGEFEEALDLHEQALETAERLENYEIASRIHIDLGLLYAQRTELATASDHFQRAMEQARETDDLDRRVVAVLDLADTELDRGNVEAAAEYARRGYELAEELDRPARTAFGTAVLGSVQVEQGRYEESVDLFEEGIELAREADDRQQVAELQAYLVDPLLEAPDPDVERALQLAREAVEAADGHSREARAEIRLGATLRADGQYERAEQRLRGALESIREGDPDTGLVDDVLQCRALLELARLERDRGDDTAAQAYAREGMDLVDRYGIGRYESALEGLLDEG